VTDDEFAVYQSLSEETEDHRWAFGTGFTDPLEGIDPSVPDGVDARALADYCLMLGDDALIYSHRLQQWMTRLPELEEETALANIALDLLGQARMLLARASQAEGTLLAGGKGRDEDQLAFFRDEHEFRNVRLAEHLDADFAELTGRLLIFSAWRLALFGRLAASADPVLAAIAAKGVRELAYHRDYAAQWVIRLGDGTSLSRGKMRAALEAIWPLAGELFQPDPVTSALPGVACDVCCLLPSKLHDCNPSCNLHGDLRLAGLAERVRPADHHGGGVEHAAPALGRRHERHVCQAPDDRALAGQR